MQRHEVAIEHVEPDPAALRDRRWPRTLGSITVADRTWPVRLVRGRLCLDRGACAGHIDLPRVRCGRHANGSCRECEKDSNSV